MKIVKLMEIHTIRIRMVEREIKKQLKKIFEIDRIFSNEPNSYNL